MRKFTTAVAVTAAITAGGMAQAGGLSDEIIEAPVVEAMPPEPASSISPAIIVLGVLGALLLIASLEDDDEPDEVEEMLDSDIRLKTDITRIGTADNGLPIYSFRYIDREGLYSGVMAQDVLTHTPEAVITRPNGFYAVDYGLLGVEMHRLD